MDEIGDRESIEMPYLKCYCSAALQRDVQREVG